MNYRFQDLLFAQEKEDKGFFPPRQDGFHEAATHIQHLLFTCSWWVCVAHRGNSKYPWTINVWALCLTKERSSSSGLSAQNLWFISSSKIFNNCPRATAASAQLLVLQPGRPRHLQQGTDPGPCDGICQPVSPPGPRNTPWAPLAPMAAEHPLALLGTGTSGDLKWKGYPESVNKHLHFGTIDWAPPPGQAVSKRSGQWEEDGQYPPHTLHLSSGSLSWWWKYRWVHLKPSKSFTFGYRVLLTLAKGQFVTW